MGPEIVDGNIVGDVGDAARASVEAIPGWATWTSAEATAWIDANVTNLASAIVVLKALTKLTLALRDKQWPGLAE